MIDDLENTIFQDLTSENYSKIDACLKKLNPTLSPERNFSIEEKCLGTGDMNQLYDQFHSMSIKLQLKALDILEKSLEFNKLQLLVICLFSISKTENSQASDILIKTINVFLKLSLELMR